MLKQILLQPMQKKEMPLLKEGQDFKNLFLHVDHASENDVFEEAVRKIENGLQARTNKVMQQIMLPSNFILVAKLFERWSQDISSAARLYS